MPPKIKKATTLWQIVLKLKDYGRGRFVVPLELNKIYTEPSIYRIVEVQPSKLEWNQKLLVHKVFRGANEGILNVAPSAGKADFRLVPKHEEKEYTDKLKAVVLPPIKIIDPNVNMPPVFKMVAKREKHSFQDMPAEILPMFEHKERYALPGETPNHKQTMGLGIPLADVNTIPLYHGINWDV